jgi:type IV pilus assembly protein PilC
MPKFKYTVQDSQGNVLGGKIEAPDEDQAVLGLQNKGYFILSIGTESTLNSGPLFKNVKFGKKIKQRELAFFAEQLSTLLTGGIPLVKSLTLLSGHTENASFSGVLSSISKDVASGGALFKALEKHPKIFSNMWISLVQAGEMGGQLPGVLRQISEYIHSQEAIKSKVITALMYPAVLLLMSGGVLTYFITYIVPVFAQTFSEFNVKLPLITVFVVGFSKFVSANFLFIVLALIALMVGIRAYISTYSGRMMYSKLQLNAPIFGKFIKNILLERMLSTMGTLIRSGVSILNTLAVLEGVLAKNLVIQKAIKSSRNEVTAGTSISTAFKNTEVFPPLITEMIWMGEESGKLPDIIYTLSNFYTEQINQFIARFSSLVDPVLIIFIGGLILVVVLSIYLPIFKLSQIRGG